MGEKNVTKQNKTNNIQANKQTKTTNKKLLQEK